MGWSDRAVSPAIWTPQAADAGGMSLDDGVFIEDGKIKAPSLPTQGLISALIADNYVPDYGVWFDSSGNGVNATSPGQKPTLLNGKVIFSRSPQTWLAWPLPELTSGWFYTFFISCKHTESTFQGYGTILGHLTNYPGIGSPGGTNLCDYSSPSPLDLRRTNVSKSLPGNFSPLNSEMVIMMRLPSTLGGSGVQINRERTYPDRSENWEVSKIVVYGTADPLPETIISMIHDFMGFSV